MSETDPQHLQPADNLEYVNYLKSIEDKWPEYTRFRKFLEDNSKGILPYQRPGFTGSVILCDVLSDSSRQSSIIFEAGKIASIHSLEHFLSNPPKGLRSRIIILDLKNTGKTIDQRVLNLLRLKFNVEPLFYGVLFRFCELSRPRLSDVLNMGYINFKEFQNSTSASYTDFIAIIAINQGSAPLEDVLYIEYCSALFSNLHDGHSISDNENFCDFRGVELTHFGRIKLFQVFAKLLQAQQTTSSEQDKFDYLVSIAKLHSAVCHQNISNFTRRQGDESDWNNLAIFSRNVCQFRRDIRTFAFYAKQKFGGAAYQTQLEYIRSHQEDLLAEVQELESCLRNELQFNVSLSSLKESRLSIEEGKRIRLITILAFIFIPTSLASSIFGMNVQQINGTGGNIWSFIATAIVLTVTAFSGWGLTSLAQKFWQASPPQTSFSRKNRLRDTIEWIGHPVDLMKKPWGFLFGLITNDRFGPYSRRRQSYNQSRA